MLVVFSTIRTYNMLWSRNATGDARFFISLRLLIKFMDYLLFKTIKHFTIECF